jgi:hypothetical protein
MATEPLLEATIVDGTDSGKQVTLERAGRYYLGLAYRYGAGTLSLDGDFQPGLRDDRAQVSRRVPTWNARAGLTHALSTGVLLGVGIFTDRSTETLGDGLVSARADFYGMTLGLRLDSTHALAPSEPVDTLVLATVFALRYARGIGETTTLWVDPEAAASDLLAQRPGHIGVHELGLHVGSALYF